jgi:hypothetical protein
VVVALSHLVRLRRVRRDEVGDVGNGFNGHFGGLSSLECFCESIERLSISLMDTINDYVTDFAAKIAIKGI